MTLYRAILAMTSCGVEMAMTILLAVARRRSSVSDRRPPVISTFCGAAAGAVVAAEAAVGAEAAAAGGAAVWAAVWTVTWAAVWGAFCVLVCTLVCALVCAFVGSLVCAPGGVLICALAAQAASSTVGGNSERVRKWNRRGLCMHTIVGCHLPCRSLHLAPLPCTHD